MDKKAISVTEPADAGGATMISGFPVIPTVSTPSALSLRRRRALVTQSEAEGEYGDAISVGASEAAAQLSRKIGEGFLFELEKISEEEKAAIFGWLMGAAKKTVAAQGQRLSKPPLQAGIEKLRIRAQSMKPPALSAPIHPLEGRGPVPGAEFEARDRRIAPMERKI